MTDKNSDAGEYLALKKKVQISMNNKLSTSILDKKADLLKKYHGSFNSNPEHQQFMERHRSSYEIDINSSDPYLTHEVSIEKKSKIVDKEDDVKISESDHEPNSLRGLINDEVSKSQYEFKFPDHTKPDLQEKEVESNLHIMASPEGKLDHKKKTGVDKHFGAPILNTSHLDNYLKNHPMEKKVQENQEKFNKANDKNKWNVHNNYLKQKMCLMKNIETKMMKIETPLNKNLPTPIPMSFTALNIKPEKISRASTKQKSNQSNSQTKNVQQFGILNKFEDKCFKKKSDRKPLEPEEKHKKTKNDFEFNHVFKILDFLDKDKSLKLGRKKIQDKMKDLGRDSFNENNKKNDQIDQLNEANFQKEYKMKGVLGKGSYGEVRFCVNEKNTEFYAVKIYPKKFLKDKIKRQNIQNEKDILMQIEHENIIKLYKVVEGVQSIYFLTEYAGRESLHEVLTDSGKAIFTEDEAKPVIWQLCQAIVYLHRENIIHRDIKLHNILINDEDQLKLIDFGFALKLKENELIHVFCGTPSYMSPEIINRTPYDGRSSDIWAIGVCAYRMVVGTFPFRGNLNSIN